MKKTEIIINSLMLNNSIDTDAKSNAILVDRIDSITVRYKHELFPGLSEEEIQILVQSYKRKFPEELIEFLKLTNGAWLFARNIAIGGLEYNPFKYTGCKVPMGIRNIDCKRSKKTPKEWLFFAEYVTRNLPRALVCVDCSINGDIKPVYVVIEGNTNVIKQWDSIDDWFASEFERYEEMYIKTEYDIIDIAGGQVRNMYFPEVYK